MDYSEIKTFVRSHADTDTTDAPDTNLDVYARAAYNDIKRRLGKWDEYHGSDTLTTTNNVSSYVLTGASFSSQDLEKVTSVVGPTQVLDWVPWTMFLEMSETGSTAYKTSEADFFTVKDGTLYLHPTPNGAVSYTVYGFQVLSDWPSGATECPLPRHFDEPICWYMLSKYYQAQEDLELARLLMADYEQGVNRLLQAELRVDAHRPRILGGLNRRGRLGYSSWVRRMTEG